MERLSRGLRRSSGGRWGCQIPQRPIKIFQRLGSEANRNLPATGEDPPKASRDSSNVVRGPPDVSEVNLDSPGALRDLSEDGFRSYWSGRWKSSRGWLRSFRFWKTYSRGARDPLETYRNTIWAIFQSIRQILRLLKIRRARGAGNFVKDRSRLRKDAETDVNLEASTYCQRPGGDHCPLDPVRPRVNTALILGQSLQMFNYPLFGPKELIQKLIDKKYYLINLICETYILSAKYYFIRYSTEQKKAPFWYIADRIIENPLVQ
jgi:hypothetical protein